MNWRNPFNFTDVGSHRIDWQATARVLIFLSLVIFAFQIHNALRIRDFEAGPPEAVEGSGRIWFSTSNRGDSALYLDTGTTRITLSCGSASAIGGSSAGLGKGDLLQGGPGTAAWIDVPVGFVSGTDHCPLRVAQRGRQIIDLSAADIAETQWTRLAMEVKLVGTAMFALPLLFLVVARRRDKSRRDAASAAWRRRHDNRDDQV